MKAVLMEGFGGVEVLKVGEAVKPAPAEGQVLVKVIATTINRPDLVQREGKYPPPPPVILKSSASKWQAPLKRSAPVLKAGRLANGSCLWLAVAHAPSMPWPMPAT